MLKYQISKYLDTHKEGNIKMRKLKGIAFCVLLIAMVMTSLFVFTSCNDEPTETVTITYEKRDDGVVITGYNGVLASDSVLTIPNEIEGAKVVAIKDEAFRGKSDLRKIILPTSITEIGEAAFKNCENLESVNIPVSVKEIKDDTFYGCESLKVVDIPENVESIGEDAFKKCSSIEELTVHGWALSRFDISSLKALNIRGEVEISFGMFSECKKLETLTIPFVGSDIEATADTHFGYIFGASEYSQNSSHIPSTLTKVVVTGGKIIDDYAFYGCDSISTIMLPKSIETIGIGAFEGCSALEKATIPALTRYIGANAFKDTSLKSATIPSLVATIAEGTFAGCDRLESVTISEGVSKIMPGAFIGCNALASLDIASLEQWLSFEFASCYDSPLYYAGKLYIAGKLAETITIPENITKIPNNAFYRCNSIKNVKFNEGLVEIGDYAFAGCVSLKTFSFPDTLKKIGTASFSNCIAIESLTIGKGVVEIGEYAFNLTSSLKSLDFSAEIYTLPNAIFRESGLVEINIKSNVNTVSATAFEGTNRIKVVTAPITVLNAIKKDSLTAVTITRGDTIADEFFMGAKSLKSVTLSSSVERIGKSAFLGCTNLYEVVIPNDSTLATIDEGAFKDCTRLTSFVIGENVSEIGSDAFLGCYRLAEVYNLSALTLDKDTDTSGILTYSYIVNTTLDTPSAIIKNGNYTFVDTGSEKLLLGYFGNSSVITLPTDINDELYSIAPYAFAGLDIRVITIPETVTKADITSFNDMPSLVEIEAVGSIILSVNADTRARITTLYLLAGGSADMDILSGFSSLTTLHLGATITSVDAMALATELPELSSFIVDSANTKFKVIDDNLYEILTSGDKLVRACPKTTDYFTLPITTYEIGDYAFYNCTNLNTLYIEEGSVLAKIGAYSFMNAASLYSLELPYTIEAIGESAFLDCVYLSEIEFNGDCKNYSIKGGCLIENSTNKLIRAFGDKGVCEIPSGVVIGSGSFVGQTTIKKIVIPSAITIEDSAFKGLSALEEITVDATNTEYKIVDGCLIRTNTNELVLATIYAKIPTDGSVKKILGTAFAYNTKITSIVVPESVIAIESGAFEGCTSLTTVTAPANLLSYINPEFVTTLTIIGTANIDKATLESFTSLESITIGKDVKSVEEGAFINAGGLTKIEVDKENTSLKAIDGALIDLNSKTVIALTPGAVIPNDGSATKLGAYAFANKENAVSLVIPATITAYSENAIYNIKGLKTLSAPLSFIPLFPADEIVTLTITAGDVVGNSDLASLISLESLTIGKTVTSITPGAFVNCEKLTAIATDSENTSYVAKNGCLIEIASGTVILGVGSCDMPLDGTVKAIADYAFYNNKTMTQLVIPTSVVTFGENSLVGCTSLVRVFIPRGVMDTFISTTGITGAYEIYEYSETKPTTDGNFWYIENGSLKIWW